MKPFTPEDVEQLSFDFLMERDNRPQLLKVLTEAAPPTERYNRFLFEFTRKYSPELVVETGTDRGRSAAHFALGNPEASVFTIDIDRACSENADSLQIRNIIAVTADSLLFVDKIRNASVDVLFLDSLHQYDHVSAELKAYAKKLKPNGIAFFDDIALDAGMRQFWADMPGRKFDLSHLHISGFGCWVPG